ncbi:MAG TPA: DNA/RNA non-specific endonuclease [Chitinophagaceae bacterium]|jgi:endonuclease G|nr:DNA/RNA non-specific endonuclease [Chitinophagaceae bacterium]
MPYNPSFIQGHTIPLPEVSNTDLLAPLRNDNGTVLNYHHHSVVMNKKRRFAFYSASNIDGETWEPIERSGKFLKDDNMDHKYQLGDELYDAIGGGGRKNDFDEGHLTSFQEVLWGKDPEDSERAGADTFYFSNCVPQHSLLNRGAWKSLEQYVTKKGANNNDIAVCVFSGPLFRPNDPYFIEKVDGHYIQIPCIFWKIIYYRRNGKLNAVGFMMSHEQLLLDEGTVTFEKSEVKDKGIEDEDIFMAFPKATTYQVRVELIRELTKLNFHLSGVNLPYTTNDKKEIVYKRIDIIKNKDLEEVDFKDAPLDYRLDGIEL